MSPRSSIICSILGGEAQAFLGVVAAGGDAGAGVVSRGKSAESDQSLADLTMPGPYASNWLSNRWRGDQERTAGRDKWISRYALTWFYVHSKSIIINQSH